MDLVFGAEGGIVSEGVAQVIDDLGNPRSPLAESHVSCLSHFVSLRLVSARLIASANTGITPPPDGHTPHPLDGQGLL